MADIRNFSKEFLREFIDLYRSLTNLWKIKSRDYSNRDKKNSAYQQLVDKLKTIEPNADREMVIKKINSLRSSYRKEKKKVNESLKSGNGADDVYTSSLWYFDLLNFLDDQETPLEPVSNFGEEHLTEQLEQADYENPDSVPSYTHILDVESPRSSSSNSMVPPRQERSTRRKKDDTFDQVLSTVSKRLCEKKIDGHEIFGRSIADKLRNVRNDQRIYLERLIHECVFEAELGNLSRDSYVCAVPTIMRPMQQNYPYLHSVSDTSHSQPTYSPISSLSSLNQSILPRPTSNLSTPSNNEDINNYVNNFSPYSQNLN